jgi:hypothetical protein
MIMDRIAKKKRGRCVNPVLSKKNFDTVRNKKTKKPRTEKNAPHVPKKCMGRLAYFPTNTMDARSRPPVI